MDPEEWPPEGYSEPQEYEFEEWEPYVPAILLFVGLYFPMKPRFAEFASVIGDYIEFWHNELGTSANPLLSLVGVSVMILFVIAIMGLFFLKVVVPIHERIHYEVSDYLDLEPTYTEMNLLGIRNPAVTNWKIGITRKENLQSLLSPLILIGIISGLFMAASSGGIIPGFAAVAFYANTAASGGDIFHAAKILGKPPGTLFTNFEGDGDTDGWAEFVVPKK